MPFESAIPDPAYENDVLGFINECEAESDSFLRAQPGFHKIKRAEDMIIGDKSGPYDAPPLSIPLGPDAIANHIGKAATQLTSAMTDTRPFWEYRTFNKRYDKHTQVYGKISLHLWLQRQWDMRWADMIRHCCTGGSAYANLGWDADIQDLSFHAEDCRDVLPIRPGDYYSIQSCFGVMVRRERTVNYLKMRYPEMAAFFHAEKDGSDRSQLEGTRYERLMERLGSPFWNAVRPKKTARDIPRVPTATERTLYLNDRRIHKGRDPLYMGNWHLKPDADCPECTSSGTPHALDNWSYMVRRGEPIYPNKRLIVAVTGKVIYDGPSPYWHGLFPLPKLTLDPWPNSYIGKGLIWDAMPMQRQLNRMLAVLDSHFEKWKKPDLFADKNSVSESQFNKIHTDRPGLKMRFNPTTGKGVELRYPDQLPAYFFDFIKFVIEEIGTLSGSQDMSQLLQLNQLPSADAVEHLMEKMTPEIRLRSRILEAFLREFAIITAYNIAQYKTMAERMMLLGPDGITFEDFDFDPGSLVPDYVHADDFDDEGVPTAIALARGPRPRYDRAREFLRQFTMHIAPGSLLSASEIERKLLYLQLARAGIVDNETLANVLGIPNYGNIPGATIIEKLANQAQMGVGMTASPAGRKASGETMPRMKVVESQ